MTAHQRTTTYFPELIGDEQRDADVWLTDYLRLVIRIYQEHRSSERSSYPQVAVDAARGTGKVRTAETPRPLSK